MAAEVSFEQGITEKKSHRPNHPGDFVAPWGAHSALFLPTKSPWLNAIEPKWVYGKGKVVELLGAYELADRLCRVFDCPHYEHLSIPENAA
jgi:hypothetical protein